MGLCLISGRVEDVTENLLSLTTVQEVMLSINVEWWDWTGQVPAGRVKGRIDTSLTLSGVEEVRV
jgi:hypothetical protein